MPSGKCVGNDEQARIVTGYTGSGAAEPRGEPRMAAWARECWVVIPSADLGRRLNCLGCIRRRTTAMLRRKAGCCPQH